MKTASLIRAGEQTTYIWLDLTTAGPGESIAIGTGEERLVVILSGRATLTLDGKDSGAIGGRADVFEGPGDAVYLPPASTAVLVADRTPGELTVAIVAAEVGALAPGPARVIPAGEQRIAVVGTKSWGRTVRTILGPDDPASRLLVGETVHNGTGTWSSFPPHRHDRESADEAKLEEVYYYRVDPADGFAVQLRYDTDTGREDLRMVRDGETAAIPAGFHPVVAAPGHNLYYLWILAGEQRAMRVFIDPRYRWLNAAT
ncbi:MAG TPA: 5-deoxy-glucuronate isomerase [Candidatus Dormibacteraeota bacterium]